MIEILLHRVAVKPFDINEWDDGRKRLKELGLAVPESEDDKRAKASVDVGTVVKVGPTAFTDYVKDTPIKVGDIVAYVKNAGKFVKNPLTEEEVYILNDEDILAVMAKE